MYCAKCGNELKNNESFCPACGTKSGDTGKSINISLSADDIKNKSSEIKNNFVGSLTDLGKNKGLFFANIGLLVISMIFSLTETFKVSAILGISEGMSMFEEMPQLGTVFIIAYLIAIICLAIPLLFKKGWKPIVFLPAKVISIGAATLFFIILFIGLDEVGSSEFSSLAEFTLTAGGWFFIVSTLGAMILSFKLSSDFKKQMLGAANTEQKETA